MIEAMRKALEALEMYLRLGTPEEANMLETDIAPKAIVALKQAIEQVESVKEESARDLLVRSRNLLSQPPHWVDTPENAEIREALSVEITKHLNGYPAPPKPEWVGLTDDDIEKIMWRRIELGEIGGTRLSRAIEAKLKEKNHG